MRAGIVCAVSALAALPSMASASNWISFGKAGLDTFYADADSLMAPENGIVKVWVKIDTSKNPKVVANHLIQRWEFSCAAHQSRTTSSVAYNASGDSLSSRNESYAMFEDIVPDSIAQSLESAVCGKAGAT